MVHIHKRSSTITIDITVTIDIITRVGFLNSEEFDLAIAITIPIRIINIAILRNIGWIAVHLLQAKYPLASTAAK